MSLVEKIRQWLVPILIKLKVIKQVAFSLAELIDDIQIHLPFDIKFSVPNGNGFVIISHVQLAEHEKGLLSAQLMGTLDIQCMGEHLYSSNIQIELFGKPIFIKEKSVIRATDVVIGQINLADDNLVVAHNARKVIAKLSNNVLGQIMGTALVFLDNVTDMKSYIANFVNKSSHRILELHRKEIESNLIDSLSNGDLEYTLDETIFDEQLFIKYGKDLLVENEGLSFRFY
ncbi:MAG: hypothetical protein ACI9ES_001548 [Oceanospirillaceae bacterium]|jgi:hypothetical protein